MIRSRNENRKPFAPNFLKIPTHLHRCNKVPDRFVNRGDADNRKAERRDDACSSE